MQGSQGEAWVEAVRAALVAVAVAEDAEPMRAYMKSEMPFLGVRSAARREAVGAVFRAARFADAGAWRGAARALWFGARFREERYAAIDLLQDRRHGRWLDLEAVPLLEELIVSGAWWDLVDPLCTISLGALVAREREAMTPLLRAWSRDEDLWKRRSAILAQLKHKGATDLGLLEECIEGSMGDDDFFARKAIGWALREYAKTDAAWVRAYVARHEGSLSGLSRREALKRVGPSEEVE